MRGVVAGMDTQGAAKMKAEALGWMATAVIHGRQGARCPCGGDTGGQAAVAPPHDRQFAHSLIDKSMAIYWDRATEFRELERLRRETGFRGFRRQSSQGGRLCGHGAAHQPCSGDAAGRLGPGPHGTASRL